MKQNHAKKTNPYVGPRPFASNEQHLFFGRDMEAREIHALVVANPTVTLYAQSGAGKSSLINAHLIPLLKNEDFVAFPIVRVGGGFPTEINPKNIPNIFIFNTLLSIVPEKIGSKRISSLTLADFLKDNTYRVNESGDPCHHVIIFDQFEEIFTHYLDRWEDRKSFFFQLADVLKDDPLLRFLFVIREDFLAKLDPYMTILPGNMRARFRMELLHEQAALLAIKEPLKTTNCYYKRDVVENLVEELLKIRTEADTGETIEVRGEYIEPVQLQVVCYNLWQKIPDDVVEITEEHRKEFGDVDRALLNFYETAVTDAATSSDIHQIEIREWCSNQLITSTDTRGIVHRGPELTNELTNAAVDALETNRLIRPIQRAGAKWYELTHDRLIGPIQNSNTIWHTKREKTSKKAYKKCQKAETNFLENQHEAALTFANDALDLIDEIWDPWTMISLLNLTGRILENLGRNEEAKSNLYQSLYLSQQLGDELGLIDSLKAYGSLFRNAGEFDDAIQFFTSFIESFPELGIGFGERAMTYVVAGKNKEASMDYEKAIILEPYNPEWYVGLGDIYFANNDLDSAIAEYTNAVNFDPQNPFWHINLGEVYTYKGEPETAISEYKLAISQDPKIAEAHQGLGGVYMKLGRMQKAMSEFLLAKKLDPDNPDTHYSLGYAYRCLKEYEKAQQSFEQAISLHFPSHVVNVGLGGVFRRMERYYEAIVAYTRCLEIDENNVLAIASLAICYHQIGKEPEYTQHIESAKNKIASGKASLDTEYNQACFEALCGNAEKAVSFLTVALNKKEVTLDFVKEDIDFEAIKDDDRFMSLFKRCAWCDENTELYIEYHDTEWGVPVDDDRKLFEMLILEGMQAGLSWITILKKRENFLAAFDNFDVEKVARYNEKKIEKLLNNAGIIRNRLKLQATVKNARVFLELREEFGSFGTYLWRWVDFSPIQNRYEKLADLPAKTTLSEEISKDLKKRGMNFVGPTIIYSLMQAVGMVNDHEITCFRHAACTELAETFTKK